MNDVAEGPHDEMVLAAPVPRGTYLPPVRRGLTRVLALVTVIGASIFLLGFAVLLTVASSGYYSLLAILYIGLALAVDGLLLGGFLLDDLDPRVRLGLLVSGGLILGLAAGQLFNIPYGYWP